MLILLPILVLGLWVGVRWANSLVKPPHTLGVTEGRLAECPDSPNCVSTQASRPDQQAEPLEFRGDTEATMRRLVAVVDSMPRSRIITATDSYVHAEFRSLLLGFVDDVEFSLETSTRKIHFRSASRVGHSDLGMNRQRMDEIRQRYEDSPG